MRSPEGEDYWSTGVYREIVKQEKIVTTDSFSDAQGNVVPASHYGMSGEWQIVPTILGELLNDPDPEKSQRVMNAMLQMGKIDIEKLKQAYEGQ